MADFEHSLGSTCSLRIGLACSLMFVAFGCGGSGPTPTDGGGDATPDAQDADGGGVCATDSDCDDGLFCNGAERCLPDDPVADVDGCALAEPACLAEQTCDEDADICQTMCEVDGDADGDGHDAIECGGDDCDDADANRFPGNVELCDAHDEDCDPTTLGTDGDADGDGHLRLECCNPQADDSTLCGDDCKDDEVTVNPDALEVCDGDVDNDCNGLADAADGVCVPCPAGFIGFDGSCTDRDECTEGAPCGGATGTTCMNTSGSYMCGCPTGYTAPASGGTCVDDDECTGSPSPCGSVPGTSCVNIPGSYTCTCPSGYTASGTGGTCVDNDECAASPSPCGARGVCTNTPGSYTCACDSGYAVPASGGVCTDIDECATGADDCDTDPVARCTNDPGSFSCLCPSPFTGTGNGATGCLLNDASLSNLLPSAGSLSPAFDPAAMSYLLVLPPGTSSVTLTPSVTHPGHATVDVDGTVVASGSASAPTVLSGFAPVPVVVSVTTDGGRTVSYTVIVARGSHYLKASNTDPDDYFGGIVALSADGSTLAVGALAEGSNATGVGGNEADNSMSSAGAVYVFARSGTTWTQQAYIKASNTEGGDGFGFSVALSADGSTLAVGALREDSSATGVGGNQADNGLQDSGAVYVFTRAATTWTEQAYIKASNTGRFHDFGFSVALSADGSTLAVGANLESSFAGAAYVFTRSGTTWTQQAYVKASNTEAGDNFGSSLALSADGSTLAVGAYGEDSNATGVGGDQTSNGATRSGAVYVFTRVGTTWTQQAYIKASNSNGGDGFGSRLALSADGSTLAVASGAEASDATGIEGDQLNNSAGAAGAVYVFTRVGTTWTQQAYIKASNTGAGDGFGFSVALSGDGSTLAVGALNEASSATGIGGDQLDNSAGAAGAVYVFTRSGTIWSQQAYAKASNSGGGDGFGWRVALSGDGSTLAVGAPNETSKATGIDGDQSNNSATNAGAVYVF